MPSEKMRTTAREWLYNAYYPNEVASWAEVDDLATLLDKVRAEVGRGSRPTRRGVSGPLPKGGGQEVRER